MKPTFDHDYQRMFAFTEWVGLNYIRLHAVWCHKHKPRITTTRLKSFMTLGKSITHDNRNFSTNHRSDVVYL